MSKDLTRALEGLQDLTQALERRTRTLSKAVKGSRTGIRQIQGPITFSYILEQVSEQVSIVFCLFMLAPFLL